ncbi:MAG: hypothetical protein AAB263_10405 [Planctomycetota bacterium]
MTISVRFISTCFALILTMGFAAAEDKAARKGKPVDYQANLALVPTTDPKATKTITLRAELAGQHPRLLFTNKEIEVLREASTHDAVLKQAIDDVIAIAGVFGVGKGTPAYIKDDTPAIWLAGGTYSGLSYAYHLSKETKIKDKIIAILNIMLREPYWADTAELDSSMGAGNNMLMTGLLFDAIYTELEPEFRTKMAAKILLHVRRMWYLGHQKLAVGPVKYWQGDPANNHRWHRNAGMAACLLAIADEPGLDTGYMMEQFKNEMDFILKWQPHDGDCHEGTGYQVFGFTYLALASRMMDRALGTTYQSSPCLRNAWAQQLYFWAPGRGGNVSFGDDDNGNGFGFDRLDAGFFAGPQLSRDKLAHAALTFRMETFQKAKKDQKHTWPMLVFYDPTLSGGDYLALPTNRLFADLGVASMRDNWTPNGVALTFKCGPTGGYRLNEYAWANKNDKGEPLYVNVAHDDPDANSFALAMAGDLIFHPGTYSMPKSTETISTILVDGKGQVTEGYEYTQPIPKADMRTLSYLTGWKEGTGGRVIIEGEASSAYRGITEKNIYEHHQALPDPIINRFRRTAVWMPGEYILLLDDIVAAEQRAITWLGITEKGVLLDATNAPNTVLGTAAGKGGKTVAFQVAADVAVQAEIKPVKLVGRRGDLTMDQFRITAQSEAVHFACVLDPWGKKPAVSITKTADGNTVTVIIGDKSDTWTWKAAADGKTPSLVQGTRGGQALIELTEKDLAPHGE